MRKQSSGFFAVGVVATLVIVLLTTYCEQSQCANGIFAFSCRPTRQEILSGEPLFVKIFLTNGSADSQRIPLLLEEGMADSLPWRLEISLSGGPFREIQLSRLSHSVIRRGEPLQVAPGGELRDWVVLWFSAYGDLLEERGLVFQSSGVYRYRITFQIPAYEDRPAEAVSGEGQVTVSGRPKGFSEMVRGLRTIMGDQSLVAYRDVKKLDALLTDLEGSPYASFVKWQRIRSYLTDGVDDKGYDVLKGPRGKEEADRLFALANELVAAFPDDESPLTLDATTMQAIRILFQGDKIRAQKMREELEAKYGTDPSMRKLRKWAR